MMGAHRPPAAPAPRSSMTTGRRSGAAPPGSPEEDGDRFIEIWNLVFMQFEQFEDGLAQDLAAQSIDTGMGLLAESRALLQGQARQLRHRPDLRSLIEASACVGRGPGRGRANVHHRLIQITCARVSLPDRRRCYALERGSGLRAAADHATSEVGGMTHLLVTQDPVNVSAGADTWCKRWGQLTRNSGGTQPPHLRRR